VRFVTLAVLLACFGAACAQLIGTDFTGTPRGDASPADADARTDDATVSDGPGARDGDVAEDASDAPTTDDAMEPRWAYCELRGSLCSCISYSIPVDGGDACDETQLPSGFCCADPGYPYDDNATCTCGAWTCHVSELGTCLCGAYTEGGAGETCSGSFCCAHAFAFTCSCDDASATACVFGDADTPVTSCAENLQPCPRGGKRVTSCSAL
jgi:hypothetical protein